MRHAKFEWALFRWGETVTVKKLRIGSPDAEYLLIETDTPNPDEPLALPLGATERSGANLLPLLQNDTSNWGNTERSTPEPHLQFANAVDDDRLIEFVKSYGPLFSSGDRDEDSDQASHATKMSAFESLDELRAERRRFASLLHLIGVLKEPVFSQEAVQAAAKEVIKGYDSGKAPIDLACHLSRGFRDRTAEILLYEDLLGFLLKFQFPPQVAFRGPKARPEIAVLPERSGRGFRHILYGLLLRELQGEALPSRNCAYGECGRSFRPDRINQTCCGKKCSWKKASKKHYYGKGRLRKKERRESRLRGCPTASLAQGPHSAIPLPGRIAPASPSAAVARRGSAQAKTQS